MFDIRLITVFGKDTIMSIMIVESLIEQYVKEHIDEEDELLKQLARDAHVNLLHPRMMSGHLQGKILKMFCRIINPTRVLEIGTYTAYATLCMASGISQEARIHTIEVNDELEDFIRKYVEKSRFKDKISLHIGNAEEIIPTLNETFDLIFIDANKRHYLAYYHLVFPYVRQGGVILVDNTLWDGKVLTTPHHTDKQTIGIQEFNDFVATDKRVEKVILPIRDGLTILWKK